MAEHSARRNAMPQQRAAHQFARDLLCGAAVVWRDKFLPVNRIDKEQRAAILKKYGGRQKGEPGPISPPGMLGKMGPGSRFARPG